MPHLNDTNAQQICIASRSPLQHPVLLVLVVMTQLTYAGVAMDAACDSLRQVAASLQQCLEEDAPKEKKYVLLLKGLACIAELKNQNQRLCEESERVRLAYICMSLAWASTLEQ